MPESEENPKTLLFNNQNIHQKAFNRLSKTVTILKEGQKPDNIVDWFKQYMNDEEFTKSYLSREILEHVAQATYWSEQVGLAPYLKEMTLEELDVFNPVAEKLYGTIKRSLLVREVVHELEKTLPLHEVSYALRGAVHALIHKKRQEDKINPRAVGGWL